MAKVLYPENYIDSIRETKNPLFLQLNEIFEFVIGIDIEFNLPSADLDLRSISLPMSPLLVVSDLETMISKKQENNVNLRMEFISEITSFDTSYISDELSEGINNSIQSTNEKIDYLYDKIDKFDPLKHNLKTIFTGGIYANFLMQDILEMFNCHLTWDLISNISDLYSKKLTKDNEYLGSEKLQSVISQYDLLHRESSKMSTKSINVYKSSCNVITGNHIPPYTDLPKKMFNFLQNHPI